MDALENNEFHHTSINEGFVDDKPTIKKESDVLSKIKDKAIQTKNVLANETKTLFPEITKTVKTSSKRLDSRQRIIEAVPNSVIYYAIISLGLLMVAKKL